MVLSLIFFQNQFVWVFFLKKNHLGISEECQVILDPDHARRFEGLYLGTNFLQRLLADDTSK